MPPNDSLPIPIDIPWKLAATTQNRHQAPYDEFLDASITLFHYEPKVESLATDYPTERVIYFKVLVTIYPAKMPKEFGQLWFDPPIYASDHLDGLSGVWHALLDLKVRPDPDTKDLIRPYFHAAAPTSRELIETGVIGADQTEASSNSIAVGKSATDLHETIYSSASSHSTGAGLNAVALSYSKGTTATDVFTERTLNERIDTTMREASQERRELLSHHTNVSNALSLLTTYHLGSPYARFSLWPRPISLLSLDPADPNLWYMELLRRRSSGLKGIQEFLLVLVVPKNQDFCIEAELKRFFVADRLPTPPTLDENFGRFAGSIPYTEATFALNYLYQRFPRGTPLDELDLDLKVDPKVYPSPVVDWWSYDMWGEYIILTFVSPPPSTKLTTPSTASLKRGYVGYKSFQEVYLEAMLAKYERALAASPLERGLIVVMPKLLTTCYELMDEQPPSVKSYKAHTPVPTVGPPPPAPTNGGGANDSDTLFYSSVALAKGRPSQTKRGREVVAKWNQLQRTFSQHLELTRDWSAPSMDLSDPRYFDLFLSAAADLAPSDPRNVAVSDVVQRLPLSKEARARVSRSGLATLRDLARYLKAAPSLEGIAELTSRRAPATAGKTRARTGTKARGPEPFRLLLDRETRASIADAMRKTAAPNAGRQPPREPPE